MAQRVFHQRTEVHKFDSAPSSSFHVDVFHRAREQFPVVFKGRCFKAQTLKVLFF